ncbi:hypothetical protein OC844_004748 [Tilletia horrida]|nr:hypothetical protein OC844_004748 [Tilletia horrida]
MSSTESRPNFKTPSRRDSLRRMKVLQSEAWSQLTSADDAPAAAVPAAKQSPIVSQEAYVPLPTQPSSSSIHSGFTPGGPIPSNFSYLSRSNSLATSTRPNRPKGLGQNTPARSPQLPYSPILSSTAQHPKSASLQEHIPASPATVGSPSKHRASASLDMDDALQRTMHARPPSVEEIFAELDAAEAKKDATRGGRVSSPVKGSVSRRAAEYTATLSASDSEPAFSTMRRAPAYTKSASQQDEGGVGRLPLPPSTEPRKAGAAGNSAPVDSPTAERIIPRRSKTLSSFPPPKAQNSGMQEERSKLEKERIAEKVAQLPPNPKTWSPSQVAIYLSHVLGLTPRPIVEDVTAFVRASRMNGNVFLRLREQDLANAGVNRKWRKLMLESGKVLRRDCVQCQIWGFGNSLEDEDAQQSSEARKSGSSDDDASSEAGRNHTSSVVDVAALRAGYLKVAPTSVSAMRGSVRRIKDRHAVKGMIQAFETWRTEADLSESEEDAFVALTSGRARRASYSGSIDSSDDDGEYEDEDGESIGSTRSHRERETASIKAIYGAGFVRRRAESYSSLSDAENEAQAQIDAEIEGDRSISRARVQARRKRLAEQKADDELVNAWIESLTDEEAQALANELEAKDILERGLLKPLIETALHTKDVSNTSSCSSTGSVREDLKILLGSVNQTTLAHHDLLSIVPSLNMDGELSESPSESPTVEKKESEVLAAHEPVEGSPARIAHFTPVSNDVLLAIFAEGEEEVEAIRNVEIDKQIDQFLGIKKKSTSSATPEIQVEVVSTPQSRYAAASRYADTDDQFDTTRRRKDGSHSSGGVSDLMSLFPPAAQQSTAADEVHATVKPGIMHAQTLSNASSAADEEFEISPNGSIRRRQPVNVQQTVAEEEPKAVSEEAQVATIVLAPPASSRGPAAAARVAALFDADEPVAEFQPPSVRDIFEPMTKIPQQQLSTQGLVASSIEESPAAEAEADELELASSANAPEASSAGIAQDEAASIAEEAPTPAAEPSEPVELIASESVVEANSAVVTPDVTVEPEVDSTEPEVREEERVPGPSEEEQEAVVASAAAESTSSASALDTAETAAEAEAADTTQPSVPSLTASKLPTPTLHAKRDASVDVGDISGLDLDLAAFEPIEPGGEKLAVPLTTLAPNPDGKGSIKKRSMVLVDRKRFESLARRMGVLEEQLAGLESATSAASSVAGSQARASTLRNMFDEALSTPSTPAPSSSAAAQASSSSTRVSVGAQTATIDAAMASKELSALGREFAETDFLDEELIDDDDDEQSERWGLRFGPPRLTFGAIPSYMLGLGAGIGFVLVSEVIQRASRLAR